MNSLKNKVVAVTGARGFIGGRLVHRLAAHGARVRILARSAAPHHLDSSVTVFSGDLSQPTCDLVPFVDGADVLYHCAAEIRRPELMQAVNVCGTQRLIEAARERIGRWVQLSSVGAYGPVRDGVVTERWPESPVGNYERTKTEADRLVLDAAKKGAFPAVVLRPSIVYGPTMRNRSLLQLIGAVNRGVFFFIGSPGASANYVHVENVVDALLLCGHDDRALGQVFILSDHMDLESFVRIIATALKRPVPKLRLPRMLAEVGAGVGALVPAFPLTRARVLALTNRSMYSNRHIRETLNFDNRIAIEDGIREMASCYLQDASGGKGTTRFSG